MLVVVLVLENPDRFAIKLQNKLIPGHRSLCGHGIPMHRGRARRRERGRFQISEFGFKITNPAASKVPLPKPLCLANFNRSLVLGSCSMTAFGIPPKCPAAFTWTCFGMV